MIVDRRGRWFVYDVDTNANDDEDAVRRAGVWRRGMGPLAERLGEELRVRRAAAA